MHRYLNHVNCHSIMLGSLGRTKFYVTLKYLITLVIFRMYFHKVLLSNNVKGIIRSIHQIIVIKCFG